MPDKLKYSSILALLFLLAGNLGLQAGPGSLPEIKLTTSQEGIHRVTAAALAPALGLSPGAVTNLISQGALALLHRGQPVGWVPGANDGEILFHAESLHNIYTDQNAYWLVAGTNIPPGQVNGAAPIAQINTCFFATTNFEQDLLCRYDLGTNPDSNYWYWTILVAGFSFLGSFSDTFAVETPSSSNLVAQINVRVCGATTATHTFTVNFNGVTNSLWTGSWSGTVATNFLFSFPSTLLTAATNTVTFTAIGNFDQWLLGGFQIQYPSLYLATGGNLVCSANSNEVVTIDGFSNSNITVLDITQPYLPLQVSNLLVEPVAGSWQVSFVPLQPGDNYSVCQAGSEWDVIGLQPVWPVGLANVTNRAACIILAPTNFLSAAQPLVDYRNSQGLETKLVSLDSVYNEFNGGIQEPMAISNFLSFASLQWTVPPAYVLFMGKGTFDYRNRLGVGDNFVPPLMVPSLYGLVASDSVYGGTAPQFAIGRLPVTNVIQVAGVISKIKAYESTAPRKGTAVLLADLSDTLAGDFPTDMAAVQSTLAGAFTIEAILPSNTASNTVTMRDELLADLDSGADLFCYYGHGAAEELGDAGYLTLSDVSSLADTNLLPFVSAMTCLSGFFAQPGESCLAEALVVPPQQGAIAVLSASGFSLDQDAIMLNQGLMSGLASGNPGRLGDFVRPAAVGYNEVPHFTPSAMYNLLGDPALLYRAVAPPPPLPPQISALNQNSNGTFTLSLAAQPSQIYSLLATTNLTLPLGSWSVLSTGTVPFGPFQLTDGTSTNFSQRFYRLATQSQ